MFLFHLKGVTYNRKKQKQNMYQNQYFNYHIIL